jgi:hypothetical protein
VGGGGYKERVKEVNMVEYYALMYENGKMRPVETVPAMGEGIKENDGGRINLWYIVRNLVNVTMYPQYNDTMAI